MNRRLTRVIASLALPLGMLSLTMASGGCEAIVTGQIPSFGCAASGGSCPPGQVCSPAGECIQACPDTPCPAEMRCITGLCIDPRSLDAGPVLGDSTTADSRAPDSHAPDVKTDSVVEDVVSEIRPTTGDIGSKCAVHADCLSTLCGDTSILTDPVVQAAGGPVCTKACCRSEDCPASHVCFGPGGGGNYCVKAALLPRAVEAGTLGMATGGASCSGPAACRSGVCVAGKCADACCLSSDCGTGTALCRRETVDGHQVHACASPPQGAVPDNMLCSTSASCTSGLCVDSYCRPRCCGQKTCAANPAFDATSFCAYVEAQPTTELITGCFLKSEGPAGNKLVGDTTCTQNSDCKTNICALGTVRVCTDVCCTDDDCAAYPLKRCRPAPSPNSHRLTCQ